ncbi:hypothetical protein [Brevundimonas vesicularis]|nr:hypothetical protein [Brevundimonas vesicularis]
MSERLMPKANDTEHLRFTLKGESGPFWQTNATIASVGSGTALLDGLDRQIAARIADLRRAGEGRWTLDLEVRARP